MNNSFVSKDVAVAVAVVFAKAPYYIPGRAGIFVCACVSGLPEVEILRYFQIEIKRTQI